MTTFTQNECPNILKWNKKHSHCYKFFKFKYLAGMLSCVNSL